MAGKTQHLERDGKTPLPGAACSACAAKDEIIRKCKELLCSRSDPDFETVTLLALVTEATNAGDYFPAAEIRRLKNEIQSLQNSVLCEPAEDEES